MRPRSFVGGEGGVLLGQAASLHGAPLSWLVQSPIRIPSMIAPLALISLQTSPIIDLSFLLLAE